MCRRDAGQNLAPLGLGAAHPTDLPVFNAVDLLGAGLTLLLERMIGLVNPPASVSEEQAAPTERPVRDRVLGCRSAWAWMAVPIRSRALPPAHFHQESDPGPFLPVERQVNERRDAHQVEAGG